MIHGVATTDIRLLNPLEALPSDPGNSLLIERSDKVGQGSTS